MRRRTDLASPLALRTLLLSAIGVAACGGKLIPQDREASEAGSGGTGLAMGNTFEGCSEPSPLMEGVDSGIFRCAEGHLWRAESKSCPNYLPRPARAVGGAGGMSSERNECSSDLDCPGELELCEEKHDGELRICNGTGPGIGYYNITQNWMGCSEGCEQDTDCADNEVCVCGDPIGRCHEISEVAGCRADADCSGGSHCMSNVGDWRPGAVTFACQLPEDECQSPSDCDESLPVCLLRDSSDGAAKRSCAPPIGSSCGRPFLIDEETRSATAQCGAGWDAGLEVRCDALSAADREAIVRHWTRVGLMEHASIAAFARFSLQLLSLGAPAHLIEGSHQAQVDETKHARIAFAVARSIGGVPVEPGPLPVRGALDDLSPETILRTTIAEGCIGETRAALEAREAAALATDGELRRVLLCIAEEEGHHAALAWKAVRWMLEKYPHLVPSAEAAFADAAPKPERGVRRTGSAQETEKWGVLSAPTQESVWRTAFTEVIRPCAEALFSLEVRQDRAHSSLDRTAAIKQAPLA